MRTRTILGIFWITTAVASAAVLAFACAAHNDTVLSVSDASPTAMTTSSATRADAAPPLPPPPDAGDPCALVAWRGGAPSQVVCPGTAKCGCEGPAICCMQRLDSNSGACTTLGACRNIAVQCDGPEDCNADAGNVCCLEDRSGGGTSCKAQGSCLGPAEWLCRSDNDCVAAPTGPRCTPIDLGVQGVDDKGLDGLLGICGK
jgi:hypothetical protein